MNSLTNEAINSDAKVLVCLSKNVSGLSERNNKINLITVA